MKDRSRWAAILEDRESGMTLEAVGIKHNLTREYVRQVVNTAKKEAEYLQEFPWSKGMPKRIVNKLRQAGCNSAEDVKQIDLAKVPGMSAESIKLVRSLIPDNLATYHVLITRIAELEAELADTHRKWCEQLNLANELYIICKDHDLDVMGDAWKRAKDKKNRPHDLKPINADDANKPKPERDDDIYILREKGGRFTEIAAIHNISVARCRQIYSRELAKNKPAISSIEWNDAYKRGFDHGKQCGTKEEP